MNYTDEKEYEAGIRKRLSELRQKLKKQTDEYEAKMDNIFNEEYEKLSDRLKGMLNELRTTVIKTYGGKMRFLFIILFLALFIGLYFWLLPEQLPTDGPLGVIASFYNGFPNKIVALEVVILPFILVSIILSCITVSIMNGKARRSKKRLAKIEKDPDIVAFFNHCKEIGEIEATELKATINEVEDLELELTHISNRNTLFVYVPAERANSSFNYSKSIQLWVDGMKLASKLPAGVSRFKVNPGFHNIRFVEERLLTTPSEFIGVALEKLNGGNHEIMEINFDADTTDGTPACIEFEEKAFKEAYKISYRDFFDTYSDLM